MASAAALQPLELVAQPRRFLEFQVGGGGAHLLFQIGDDRLDIVADEFALAFGRFQHARIHHHMVALIHRAHDVGDVLLDAERRDAVFACCRPPAWRGGGWSRPSRAPSSR